MIRHTPQSSSGKNEKLVTIGPGGPNSTRSRKLEAAPVADKFFLLALLSGVFGMLWFGVHLWLTLNGQIEVRPSYPTTRLLHSVIQIYLFFGLFILGFSAQSAPKLFEAPQGRTLHWLILACPVIVGIALLGFNPELLIARVLIAAPFLIMAIYIITLLRHAPLQRILGIGFPLTLGLLAFAAGAFLSPEKSTTAAFLLWCGPGAVVLATGQQFISGFLGGRFASTRYAIAINVLLLTAFSCFVLSGANTISLTTALSIIGLSSLLTLIIYIIAVDLRQVACSAFRDPLALAFTLGTLWALYASLSIISGDIAALDRVTHVLATGWIFTITIGASSKVIGFLSGKPILKSTTLILLILLWQLVPIGRGLSFEPQISVPLSWALSIAASIVYIVWGGALARRIYSMLRFQFSSQILESGIPAAR